MIRPEAFEAAYLPVDRVVDSSGKFVRWADESAAAYNDAMIKAAASCWRFWRHAFAVRSKLNLAKTKSLRGVQVVPAEHSVELTDDMLYRAVTNGLFTSSPGISPSRVTKTTRRAKAKTKRSRAR